jgi:predicted extracellular nuclease
MMAVLLMIGMLGIQPAKPVQALATDLFFSEYIEGSSNNRAVEIFNGTGAPVSLSNYQLLLFANGSGTATSTITLSGTLANNDVFVVANSSADSAILDVADQTSGSLTHTGDDALALRNTLAGRYADVIGQVGFDPGNFWGTEPVTTINHTLVRKCTINSGDLGALDAFNPATEWDSYEIDTFTYLGGHTTCWAPEPPVINEFSASTTGTDVEFIELFGSLNTDYSAYTLLEIEGDANSTNSSEGFVDEVVPIGTTDANGFFLVNLAANALENGTISLLLVKDNTATLGVDIDTDDDGVIDAPYWSEITDGVAVNDGDDGDLTYAIPALGVAYDGLPFAPGGASRIPDGTDTDTSADWVRNDFDLAGIPGYAGTIATGEAYNTPGASNQVYVETAPSVVSTIPANGGNHPIDENITITFSELVNVTDPWFSISCGTSGTHTATVNVADPVYTLNPDLDFTVGESCTVVITAANVVDDDSDDTTYNAMLADYTFSFTAVTPPERCGDTFTPTYEIQGTGETSPLAGTAVATEGVVVGEFQVGGKNGYYIQDVTGDGNPATSDGIFVYNTTTAVNVGDHVRVRGTAVEYYGITEISPVTQVWICSTGNTIAPTEVTLPVTAVSDFEKYESMLVTFPQSLIISEYFNFDRYGEIVLTSTRHMTPTALVEPGAPAQAEAAAYLLDRITLDDGRTSQNPDPAIHPNGLTFTMENLFRGGGTVTNVTGILDYYQNLYRVQPTIGAVYADVNARTTAPDITEADLKVTSFNVLNYFVTLDDGVNDICGPDGIQECRGADNAGEFDRQKAKILAAMATIDADIYGLMEIENDSPVSGNDAVADLVAGLNAIKGAGTYAYIETGAIGGDAIKQAILYKPASVTPVGDYQILDSSVDARFIDTANRPVLAQVFMDNETGVEFVVAVNHLKSKGSACVGDPDLGDGQGNCNLTRKAAAEALVDWLANPTYFPDVEKALIIGDLNSYDKEDPIDAIKLGADDTAGTTDDYLDMIFEKRGEYAYGYVYDGQTGYLDHALASQALAENIVDVNIWHINADEPDLIDYDTSFKLPAQDALYAPDAYRSSDHDPVIITLSFKGDFFVTQDFGPWGTSWPGAINLGWKYNDAFDIDTIASIEVGMLDAAGNVIVKYTADAEQVAWQIANSYITPGGQESAPFFQWYDGTPIAEGRGEDWTVVFGPSFANWNPALGFVKVVNLNGTVDYKTVPYTAAPVYADDIFEITDFGLWGQAWPGALSLGWGYSEPFDTDTITSIEVGMVDADRNVIVRYTADAEQVAWQKANGYITATKLSSAPFYQEYQGMPIMEGRDLDWTVIFGPSFEDWSPAWAYVHVITTTGAVDYDEILYTGATPGETPVISSTNLEGPYAIGTQQEFHVTLDNSDLGYPYSNVLAVFELDNITLADIASFEYLESLDGQWHNLPLTETATGVTGAFGPAAGFPIGVPYNATSSFRVTFNTPGTYPATITLYDVAADPDSVLDIFTAEVEVLPALAVTEVDLEASTVIAGPYTALPGTLASGFTMVLDPTVPWYYFDTDTITSNRPLADGSYPFYLEGTTTEIFTLVVSGTDYFLRDTYANDGTPLRVQGNFALGSYTYVGEVADALGSTDEVSLTITFVAPLAVTKVDLEASTVIAGPYTALPGTLASGFTMVLDPTVPWYYFDTDTITSTRPLADGSYPFYLEGTTTEIFTLVVSGTDYFLRDTYANDGTPLRVQGNFPLGEYTYVGEVADANGFTDEVSLTITFVAPLAVTEVALVQSTDLTTWIPVEGSLAEGYAMNLDTTIEYYYLDAESVTSNRTLADGSYPFFMTANPGTEFFAYWAERGVVEGATGWQALMWQIINGNAPMFYLKVEGTNFTLIDGLQGEPNPLRVNGGYYPGLYAFSGVVEDLFGFEDELDVSILFNDIPVAEDQAVTTPEETAIDITLVATDIEGDELTYAIVDQPAHGTVTLAGNVATYTPALNFFGEDSFTFTANDGMVDSNIATVTITVTEEKDQVQAVDDFYATDEDTTLSVEAPGVLANDIDVDGNLQAASLVTDVLHGSLSLKGDGSFVYVPNANWNGVDSFVYQLVTYPAPQNLWTDEATVTITVNPVNDAPILGFIEAATIPELVEFSFTATATDVDLPVQVLTFSLVGAPEGAAITSAGVFTWTPSEEQGPGVYTFTVMVCDDTDLIPLCDEQAVTLTVTEVNTAPVADDLTATTPEETPVDVTLVATDVDGNTLTYAIVAQPAHGTVTLVDNVATYTPALNFNGGDSFTYKANDGIADSEMAVVTITVTPVNDAPVAEDDQYVTDEDVTLTVLAPGVLDNDFDVEGEEMTIIPVADVSNGTLNWTLNGGFTFTPDAKFNGTDTFSYKLFDGDAYSNVATVTITVTPVNDWPIANDDFYEVVTGNELVKDAAEGILANDVLLDPDEQVSIQILEGPQHGTLSMNDDGSFTYTPDAGFMGTDTFRYMVLSVPTINAEWSDDAMVTIVVKPYMSLFLPIILR